jgi:hypothetical protein
MDILKTPIDIKTLIQTSTIDIYDKTKLVEKLKDNFSEDEQRLYVCNLFLFLHYHPINDFVVNLENVWKFIGFSNKANAKRLLKHNFTENRDYKIVFIRTDENTSLLIRSDEQKTKDNRGGYNQEAIMLNINTFKKLCLKANTENSDKIHDYYIKLEMIYNELMKEEFDEQKREIENQKILLEQEKETTTKLIEEQQERINLLEHKPNTHGFNLRRAGYVYVINDRSKPGHYKIGMSYDVDKRLRNLNTGSSQATLGVFHEVKTYDCETLENTVHKILQPFNIPRRREWFFFSNDTELQYALQILHETQMFLNKFNLKSSDDVIKYVTNNPTTKTQPAQQKKTERVKPQPKQQLDETPKKEKTDQVKKEKNDRVKQDQSNITETNIYKLTGQQLKNKTGDYKGVFWCTEKSKWRASLKVHYKEHFLGYFDNELDGAVVYNDYAVYLNNTRKTNYIINNIPNYLPNPRDILQENLQKQMEICSSKYIGVSYDSKRNYYVVSIKYKLKTYHLGHNNDELECAKLYNQQALYFNENDNTNYVLNDIPGYITLPVNVYELLQTNKTSRKSSKYLGVCLNKKTGKYKSVVVYNKKQIHIGTFINEIQAAQAYNKRVSELNEKFNTTYKLNEITD